MSAAAAGYWQRVIQYAEPSEKCSGEPFEWQQNFHRSLARFKGFSGPVGSGKSQALCFEALALAYENRGLTGLIGSPTYPMLRDSTFKSFREILDASGVPYGYGKTEFTVFLTEPKSTILFRALDEFERIRGTNLAWFGVDELTYCKEAAWLRLEGRMRDRRARRQCGFASWTPKGFDWVYDRFIGPDKKPNYEAFFARQNRALDPAYYESLRSSYSERFYRQEALGEYLNVFSGQAYHSFSREAQVGKVPYSPRAPLWWALDFNVNPLCSVVGQTIGGLIRVLDELVMTNSNTLAACEEFLARTSKWFTGTPLTVYIYGDASGNSRSTSGSRTDWQIVRDFFSRYPDRFRVDFRVERANPLVKDRVNCVNAMLFNYAGQRRMVFDSGCKELTKDLEQVAWKSDSHGNSLSELDKRDPARTHLSDALGYYVVREFPMKRKAGEKGGPMVM